VTRLLALVAGEVRTVTIYMLALRCRLGTRDLSALNIRDVSADGRRPRRTLRLGRGTLPLFGEPIGIELAQALTRYLAWRCSCAHLRLPLRTYHDERGIERCCACHDGLVLPANPLFISARHRRLSAKRIENHFREHRDALGLDGAVRFDSLRLAAVEPTTSGTP
jgi:hypothetical protein